MNEDTLVIDVRFAGGPILIERAASFLGTTVINMTIPGATTIPMFPHEARALIDALEEFLQ